ncbi:MAG: transposase [archaeon]|nr:transposase [archaeon]
MQAVKTVKQSFHPSEEVLGLFETFRSMMNEAIRVGIENNISSRFKLSNKVYHSFKNDLHTWYRLSAIEIASSLLKNYRREKRKNPNAKKPYVWKKFAKIGNQAYTIKNNILRIPTQPRHFVEIPLAKYTQRVLSDPSLKLGSVSLTSRTVCIAFSKEIAEVEPTGYIGIDRNLENATIASSDNFIRKFDTSRILRKKEAFSEVKSHFKRNDHRIRNRIYSKYGTKQSEIENQELHKISKQIVEKAKSVNFGIVMENIKGIRKLYRKGNFQGNKYRRRLNSWSFYKLRKMIEYKARWLGLKVIYVPPHRTSTFCAICDSKVVECTERKVWCPKCKRLVDRDENAARNILARGMRFIPIGLSSEAANGNPMKELTTEVILRADGSQLTQKS